MNRLDYGEALEDIGSEKSNIRPKNPGKKRKWREIETIKEKHRLLKELREIDTNLNYNLDDLLI